MHHKYLPGDTFISRKFDLVSRLIAPKSRKLAMLLDEPVPQKINCIQFYGRAAQVLLL